MAKLISNENLLSLLVYLPFIAILNKASSCFSPYFPIKFSVFSLIADPLNDVYFLVFLCCARKHQTCWLFGYTAFPEPPTNISFTSCGLEYSDKCRHTCVADAAILSCPCFVSVPMSLWLMVNLVIPSMPLSLVSGTTPETLLKRFLPWGEHNVMGTLESSQCCSSCCPFLGVVGRCRRACWSLHPSSPWLEAEACVSPASRRWMTVWSRPPWHCTKTSGQKGRMRGGGQEGKGMGGKCLSFKLFWQQRVSTV